MGVHADKAKKLSCDPGVLYLGQVADEQQELLSKLKATVDACCSHAPLAPSEPVPGPTAPTPKER